MKELKFMFGVLLATLAIMLPRQSVLAAETEASYSYDAIELEFTDEKVEAIGIDIPGVDLDETITSNVAKICDTATGTSRSYDTADIEFSDKKIEAVGLTVPGESEVVSYVERAAEKSVSHEYTVDLREGGTIIVRIVQTTDWTYAPGISSTLTGHDIIYQNLKAGYSIESGGSIKTTNNDGTQQIADYLRIIAPDGTVSTWYRVLAICSVNGVVTTSLTRLNY